MIHFQSCQKGATLRATELKPKTDKFIISELKTIDEDLFTKYKDVINENNFSLEGNPVPAKYQIRISADDNNGRKLVKFATYIKESEKERLKLKGICPVSPAPYFGDSLAVQHNKVELSLFGFNSKLTELIEKAMQYVLVYNNFGTRQGKGFGSFLPENMTEDVFEKILKKKYPKFWVAKDVQNPFAKINRTYQLLKSGINHPKRNQYEKSKLFEYMCGKNIRWEKREIKEKLIADHNDLFEILKYETEKHRIDDCDPKAGAKFKYRYIRAMLGLAEHNEYAVKVNDKNIDKIQIRIEDSDNKNSEDQIKRYKSPIVFKVFNNNIYLLPNPVNSIMYGRKFTFNIRLKYKDNTKKDIGELFEIETPDKFDLTDFLSEKLNGEWTLIERGQA